MSSHRLAATRTFDNTATIPNCLVGLEPSHSRIVSHTSMVVLLFNTAAEAKSKVDMVAGASRTFIQISLHFYAYHLAAVHGTISAGPVGGGKEIV